MDKTERKVAVVTGASRGAGRGIATALGRKGYRVYVTGRSEREGDATLPGTIYSTAKDVTDAGGEGIAVRVDHADDDAVRVLFEQVKSESGRIDMLVNNVAAVRDDLTDPGNFWEKSLGLGSGLIAFTSSFGASCYMHGPAYGAQKAGLDKMAADMAVDLRDSGVAAVSIWMGPLLTERAMRTFAQFPDEAYRNFAEQAETPEFPGLILAALAEWPDLSTVSGQTLIGAEIADRLGIKDVNGKQPPSYRDMLGEPRVPHPAIIR
jgi:NAD(P)-dependent dehydrogenase (short-subunit alcohol dehydrogenase family)